MSEEMKNYYEILGVPEDAGYDEVRAVYRRLAFEFHPDRNSDPAAQEYFQKVIEAFSVLSDSESRREYDAILFSDSSLITSSISSTLSADELYDSIAQQVSDDRVTPSERDVYLDHLKKSRRRRTTVQTIIAIIVILLLIFYGFKPLDNSSQSVAPTNNLVESPETSLNQNESSGTSLNQNLVVIQGPAGLRGIPGPAGRDGRIGVDGVPGPAGADGAPGPAGADGKIGPAGRAGPAGPAGARGANGASGPSGPAGAAGAAGAQGLQGIAGVAGRDGQDATVYTVKPNIGAVTGYIGPCNQDLSDTSTAPGLIVTITPIFDTATENYKLKSFNFSGFTPACRGALLGMNIILASNASANANATFQCAKTIPNDVIPTDVVKFESGSSGCTKYSGWDVNGGALDIGIIVASDLARISLIVTG